MGDCIKTIKVNVEIQENGIIRDSTGYIIGRLVDGINFNEVENREAKIKENKIWYKHA